MSDLRYIPHVLTAMSGIMCAEAIADGYPLFATPLPYCIIATAAVELFFRIRAKKKAVLVCPRNTATKEYNSTVNYNTVPDARQASGERMYK